MREDSAEVGAFYEKRRFRELRGQARCRAFGWVFAEGEDRGEEIFSAGVSFLEGVRGKVWGSGAKER